MAKVLEIEFKGGRKSFYLNPQEFPFVVGDQVVVHAFRDVGSRLNSCCKNWGAPVAPLSLYIMKQYYS